jgi:hypothetical protein
LVDGARKKPSHEDLRRICFRFVATVLSSHDTGGKLGPYKRDFERV